MLHTILILAQHGKEAERERERESREEGKKGRGDSTVRIPTCSTYGSSKVDLVGSSFSESS